MQRPRSDNLVRSMVDMFGGRRVLSMEGVERKAVVNEQQPDVQVPAIQMVQNRAKSK